MRKGLFVLSATAILFTSFLPDWLEEALPPQVVDSFNIAHASTYTYPLNSPYTYTAISEQEFLLRKAALIGRTVREVRADLAEELGTGGSTVPVYREYHVTDDAGEGHKVTMSVLVRLERYTFGNAVHYRLRETVEESARLSSTTSAGENSTNTTHYAVAIPEDEQNLVLIGYGSIEIPPSGKGRNAKLLERQLFHVSSHITFQ